MVSTTNYGGNWTYDPNGNMTSGPGGKTIDYDSFNRTRSIVQGGVTETFEYGPDRERVLRRENTEQTFYVGKLFERVVEGTVTVDKAYIHAAGRMVAVHQPNAPALEPTQAPFQYFHQDYRGSIETVTDGTGIVLRHVAPRFRRLGMDNGAASGDASEEHGSLPDA